MSQGDSLVTFDSFSLDPRVLAGVHAAGYSAPTPIQELVIPAVQTGRDVLGLAQTGTGKTAAFVLPILHRLGKVPSRKIRALVLAPTRELAEQIHEAVGTLGRKTPVRSVAIYGGVSKERQLSALRQGPQIVVACPGRLLDHLSERAIDLSAVEVLVLDEADHMCDMGFLPDVKRILRQLPAKRQTLFFSATMPEDIRELAESILTDPVTEQVGTTAPIHTVSHALYPTSQDLKKKMLFTLLETTATGRVLVFTKTKHRAKSLGLALEKAGHRAVALQGNMSQNKRQSALTGFREGKFDILVATDIAARGIDISEITHVINFDVPDTVDAYTHRIGRTGRALRTGEAFTFVTGEDEAMIRDIEKVLKKPIERRLLADFDYEGYSPNLRSAPSVPVKGKAPFWKQNKPRGFGGGKKPVPAFSGSRL